MRGPRDVPAQLASVALECIDDELALIDDRPAAVADVWREVLRSAVGACETVVLVCLDMVGVATSQRRSRRRRRCGNGCGCAATGTRACRRTAGPQCAVVEIAPELVVVSRDGRAPVVIPRLRDPDGVAEVVAGEVGATAAVLVDAAVGVNGAGPLAVAITDRVVPTADRCRLPARTGCGAPCPRRRVGNPTTRASWKATGSPRRAVAVLAGVLLSPAALCAGFSVRQPTRVPPAEDMPLTLLVEGASGSRCPHSGGYSASRPDRVRLGADRFAG